MFGFCGGFNEFVQFVFGGLDYSEFKMWVEKLEEEVEKLLFMMGVDIDYLEKMLELVVMIDKQCVVELGISVKLIFDILEVMLGGKKVMIFVECGEEYDVYLCGDENSFNNVVDLS